MIDLQRMTERLYGNSSLRDDLDDDQAAIALRWAENRLPHLVESYPDETALEEAFGTLERILRGINRLTRRADDYSAEQLRDRVGKVVEWAQEIDLPVDSDAIDAYVERLPELDNTGRVDALTQALAPDAPEESAIAVEVDAAPLIDTESAVPQPPDEAESAPDDRDGDDSRSHNDPEAM